MARRIWDEFVANKFYLLFFLSLIAQLLTYGYSLITAEFFSSEFTFERLLTFIAILAGYYLILAVVNGLLQMYREMKSRVYQRSLRKRSLVTVLQMPSEAIIDLGQQYIKEIVTDANNQLAQIVSNYLSTVVNVIVGLVVLTIALSRQSVWIAVLALILIGITVLIQSMLMKKQIKLSKEYFQMGANYRAMVSDIQNNTLSIKKLDAEDYFADQIDEKSAEVDAKGAEKTSYEVKIQWIFDLFTYAILLLILGNIAWMLYQDPSYGALFWVVFYTGIFGQLKSQISAVTGSIQRMVDFQISMDRYDNLMAETQAEEGYILHHRWRNITVSDMSFTYQSSERHIFVEKFYIERGDHISLTGPSGAGKSTFLGLLRGEYQPDTGTITYDTRKRRRLVPYLEDAVYISQALNLFNDTLRNNLCLGRDYSDEELYEMLDRAGLKEWALTLPEKLDTMISENAANLSDGQKMRIKILRGMLGQREIMIMDEPSSNLDLASSEQIQRMIVEDLADKTVIITTHDPDLVRICNRHYVIDADGTITEWLPSYAGEFPI
ncbi:MAG: ABC transporter ATP-binding protein/permease [Coriobacteriia bacterium]|nr:ABC transporter ATP-binding protein/permease [Coriobacteriia bacterium]